jgi:SAM-dependent methyltransferase
MDRTQLNSLKTDGTVMFYQHVQACQLLCGAKRILDFGAGRGAALLQARERGLIYKEFLHDLRSLGAHVTACDIDEIVREHPAADEMVVMDSDECIPFADASFDLIVSDNTFEHIEKSAVISKELLRILRPGGYICIRTPNRFGYVALIAGAMPPNAYSFLLRLAQPDRERQDKFQVFYRLNDYNSIRKNFIDTEIMMIYPDLEPSYYFGNKFAKLIFILLHKIIPKRLRPGIFITIFKSVTK